MRIVPDRWRRAWHKRRATLAEGTAFLTALDKPRRPDAGSGRSSVDPDPDPDPAAGRAEAWDALFHLSAKPRHPHEGRCGLCGRAVDPAVALCPDCGAVWCPIPGRQGVRRRFLVGAGLLSVAGGWALGRLAAEGLRAGLTGDAVRTVWFGDFLSFVSSYLWFTCAVLIMLAAARLYERWFPAGRWSPGGRRPAGTTPPRGIDRGEGAQ